jgi:ribulose-phosphate 3-epimerase
MEIIPALMPKDFSTLEAELLRVAELVPLVQLDVLDGVFVKNTSWPYGDEKHFAHMVKSRHGLPYGDKLEYEVDLMVSEPEHVIEDWMHLGVRRIIVHVESTSNIENIIRDVAAHVTRATDDALEVVSLGLAIGTTTPIEKIEPYIYDIDFVQCMGIAEIGKQGEPFDERVIGQIEKLKRLHPELIVSVDGGVSLETAPRLLEAGASRLVSGSAILGSDNPAYVIKKFRALSS